MSFLVFEFDKIITPTKLEEILILSGNEVGWKHKIIQNYENKFDTNSKKIKKMPKDKSIKFYGSYLPMGSAFLQKTQQNWVGISYGFGFGFSTKSEFNNFLKHLDYYSKK